MLCQRCHKNRATVRYAEVVDGKVAELHLCEGCLVEHQESAATGFEISKSTPRLKRVPSQRKAKSRTMTRKPCPACGTRLADVIESGKVKCARCYYAFSEPLKPLLQDMHQAVAHRGKIAHIDDKSAQLRADLQTKRALLKTTVQTEDYEEAAVLRDEIKALEAALADPRACE